MILGLYIKAELENVDSVRAVPGIRWEVDVKEPTGYEFRKNVYFSSSESYSIPNSRGDANFIVKWRDSDARASIRIAEEGIPYTTEDVGKFKCIAKFEARGLDIIKWHPRGGFQALRGGRVYAVTFQEGSWADYDSDTNEPLSVLELDYKFAKL
ncbi:UPF0587 protein C1orf123 homolog [Babesia microti strain RI]|uniref:UPF0587 protein C1orf123 homolog n=1 Tax=Babesia microti (strain RI) TaxID=1133968 RepID=A0A1R4AB86_BABMR|nr:UPF0587 protein C1orf123 homolog [Babesia microti strain RI]SJK86204.1 UPF0587 protein C1orf123 homolog [Babesia microti strain RI]|eukprot:XP_021338392.1 UPF0587 protein C1orf123 homolog [Babesia microti strain RI]